MRRLGYTRYVAQGGDWGNAITEEMALKPPPELLAVHTNMPATIPNDIAKALQSDDLPPPSPSADGRLEIRVRSTELLLQARPGLRAGNEQPSPERGCGAKSVSQIDRGLPM